MLLPWKQNCSDTPPTNAFHYNVTRTFFFLIQNFGYSRLPVGLKVQLLTVITWSRYFLESYVLSFLSPNFWVMHVLYCLWAWSNCNNFSINQPLIIGFWFMPPTTPYLINYPVSFLIRNYTSTWLLFLHSSVSPTVTKASWLDLWETHSNKNL